MEERGGFLMLDEAETVVYNTYDEQEQVDLMARVRTRLETMAARDGAAEAHTADGIVVAAYP